MVDDAVAAKVAIAINIAEDNPGIEVCKAITQQLNVVCSADLEGVATGAEAISLHADGVVQVA